MGVTTSGLGLGHVVATVNILKQWGKMRKNGVFVRLVPALEYILGYILGVFKGFFEHNYMFGHPGVKMRTEAGWWV